MAAIQDTKPLVGSAEDFLRQYYHEDILALTNENAESLEVDVLDLYKFDNSLVDDYQRRPDRVQEALDEALHEYDLPADVPIDQAHVRIVGWSEEDITSVGGYSAADGIGSHEAVKGQVAKVTQKAPVVEEAVFECQRCGAQTVVPQQEGKELQDPYQCESCERDGPFKLHTTESTLRDQQQIRLQQPPEEVERGAGATIDAVVYDDLVDSVSPGDRATISGILDVTNIEDDPSFHLKGNSVQVEETDYDDAAIQEHKQKIHELANGEHGDPYELLVDSIAPRIHGEEYDDIKLALALQMFAANELEYADGSDGRGRFHILILGDPGVGKSRLVEAVDKIAPRSVFTSGEGVSKVGLTASVVPDDFGSGKWSLEAGPIVKANEGICAVDEIDKAPEEAVEGLHTALEKQVVSVSKASFNGVELQAKTSLLAAGNPKHGRFDPYEPVPDQIDLSPTLLSRFDLMFMMSDEPEEERDREIVRQMVEDRQDAIRYTRGDIDAEEAESNASIDREVLQAWIAYVHDVDPNPVIEDESLIERIADFLNNLRQSGEGEDLDNQVPITFRKVEGVMRLAEASARIRLSETVEESDIRRAVQLIMKSMRDVEYDPETESFDADIKETGSSQSQKQRMDEINSLIQEKQGSSGGVDTDEIVDAAVELGYSQRLVEKSIENLKSKGHIYEPAAGEIRSVKIE